MVSTDNLHYSLIKVVQAFAGIMCGCGNKGAEIYQGEIVVIRLYYAVSHNPGAGVDTQYFHHYQSSEKSVPMKCFIETGTLQLPNRGYRRC